MNEVQNIVLEDSLELNLKDDIDYVINLAIFHFSSLMTSSVIEWWEKFLDKVCVSVVLALSLLHTNQ